MSRCDEWRDKARERRGRGTRRIPVGGAAGGRAAAGRAAGRGGGDADDGGALEALREAHAQLAKDKVAEAAPTAQVREQLSKRSGHAGVCGLCAGKAEDAGGARARGRAGRGEALADVAWRWRTRAWARARTRATWTSS